MTNPSLDAPIPARIRLAGGARATEARASVLTHTNMWATNTYADPNEVKPAALPAKLAAGAVELTVPRQAVVALELQIA
jgi:alpha-L-arabinofuranosidase